MSQKHAKKNRLKQFLDAVKTNEVNTKTNRREAFSVPRASKLVPWVKSMKEETIAAKNKVIEKRAISNVMKAKY